MVSISAYAAEHSFIVDYGWIFRLCLCEAGEGVTYTQYNLVCQ